MRICKDNSNHETNIDTKNLEEMNFESDLIENYVEDKEIELIMKVQI